MHDGWVKILSALSDYMLLQTIFALLGTMHSLSCILSEFFLVKVSIFNYLVLVLKVPFMHLLFVLLLIWTKIEAHA